MTQPGNRPLADIDRELKAAVTNRESATREIRRLSDIVIRDTRRVDELLAERSRAVATAQADAIRADIAQLGATP